MRGSFSPGPSIPRHPLADFYAARSEQAFASGQWGPGSVEVLGTVIHEADYESPDCPQGWNTLFGQLAATEPVVLALMDQMPEAGESDERCLDQLCERSGIEPMMVSASSWMVRNGVFEERAYPIHILQAHAGQPAN